MCLILAFECCVYTFTVHDYIKSLGVKRTQTDICVQQCAHIGGSWWVYWCMCVHTIVHSDDVKAVEELPFVLMNSLHLNIKHRGRVYLHLILSLQVLCKLPLVVLNTHTHTHTYMMISNHTVSTSAVSSLLLLLQFVYTQPKGTVYDGHE